MENLVNHNKNKNTKNVYRCVNNLWIAIKYNIMLGINIIFKAVVNVKVAAISKKIANSLSISFTLTIKKKNVKIYYINNSIILLTIAGTSRQQTTYNLSRRTYGSDEQYEEYTTERHDLPRTRFQPQEATDADQSPHMRITTLQAQANNKATHAGNQTIVKTIV